jgi:hypothetical protein
MSMSAACGAAPHASRRSTALVALGLALLSLALYAPSLGFGFVDFDDRIVLLAHPQLYDERSLLASLRQIFVEYFPREEPLLLRDVSWAIDARVFGFENPLGYHLGNALLNAANVALLFLFLRHATRRFGLALAVAGVFAVLPVHVEAVSWVMGRKDVLSACFVLLALLAQSHELEQTRAARRWSLWFATLLCTVLALAAKIAALPCVAVLALHRAFHPYLGGRRAPDAPLDWARLLRDAAPRLLPHAAATLALVVWYQRVVAQFGVIGRGPGPLEPEHLANVATFVPLVVGSYLRSLVWPVELSAYYRWPHVEIPLTTVEQLASAGCAVALAAGLVYCCLRRRDLAFFALAFGALLLPYLGLVFVDIWRADRYVYLASFAVVALVATLLAQLGQRGRRVRLAVAGLSLAFTVGCALQTLRQQSVWRDNESLWRYEASLTEPSLLSIQALASEYAKRAERETDVARKQALVAQARGEVLRGIERERTLGRRPTGYQTSEQLQLARLHSLLGRLEGIEGGPLESQIEHYETSYRLAPHRASAFALAGLYLKRAARAPELDRERLVRASFDRFVAYLAHTSHDPARRQRNAALLTQVYERRYPFLGDAVVSARRTYFR